MGGTCIYYYCVDWDGKEHSWSDFREKIMGATDPTTAAEGSLRRTIMEQYKDLGLSSEPNVGDNGVHASASPFEALCERMNWLEGKASEDKFGRAMIAAGISEETIKTWSKDPQVEVEGNKASLFDSLEDINSDECIAKSSDIVQLQKLNQLMKKNSSGLASLSKKSKILDNKIKKHSHAKEGDPLEQKLKKLLRSNKKKLNQLGPKISSLEKKMAKGTKKQPNGTDKQGNITIKSVAQKQKKNLAQLDKLMAVHDKIKKSVESKPSKSKQSTSNQKRSPEGDRQTKILDSLDKLETQVKEFAKGKKVSNPAKQARLN